MKRKPTFAKIGPVTDSTEDADVVIENLAFALKKLLKYCRVGREERKQLVTILQITNAWMPDSKLPADDVVSKLEGALSTFAPPYAWFGQRNRSLEWGFWPDVTSDDCLRIGDRDQDLRKFWGGRDLQLVNDHGNVDCGRFDKRGRWHEYWSCV